MDDIGSLVTMLADVGGTVIVTAMLYVVWQRLGNVTDKLIEILWDVRLRETESQTPALIDSKSKETETSN